MNLLGNALLAVATALTIWLPLVFGPRAHAVPQTPAVLVTITAPRWGCLVVVLGMLVARGEFDWIAEGRVAQGVVVAAGLILSGFVSLASLQIAIGRTGPVPEWLRKVLWVPPLVVPLILIAFGIAALNRGLHDGLNPDSMRPLLTAAAILTAGYAVGLAATRALVRGWIIPDKTQWIADDPDEH